MIDRQKNTKRIATIVLATMLVLPAAWSAEQEEAARAEQLWKEGAGLHVEKKYDEAVELYREALALHPTGRIHTYLAWSLSKLGRYREAVEHVRTSIEIDPDYPNAYNDLGSYLIELERPRDALPWLHKAIAMPEYCCPHFSYYQIGRAMLMLGRVETATEALRSAVQINPRYRPALRLLRRIRKEGLKGL